MKKVPRRYIYQLLLSLGCISGLAFAAYYTNLELTGSAPVREMISKSLTTAASVAAILGLIYLFRIFKTKGSLPPILFFDRLDESQNRQDAPLLGNEAWIKTPAKLFIILFLENSRLYGEDCDILHIFGVCAKVSGYAMMIMIFLYFCLGLGLKPRKNMLGSSWTKPEDQ